MAVGDEPGRIRVLCLNVWGIPMFTRRRKDRFRVMEHFFRTNARRYDIVCLQELFVAEERQRLVDAAAEGGLTFEHRWEAGVPLAFGATGTGVHVLSRWPFAETAFFPFPANGFATDIGRFDYHAGKGLVQCTVASPHGMVDVFATHLHAQYAVWESDLDDTLPDRIGQIAVLAQAIRASRAPLRILAGDLNATPSSVELRLLQRLTGMVDTLSWGLGTGEAAQAALFSRTCGYFGNDNSPAHVTKTSESTHDENCRLDFVLAATGDSPACGRSWAVADARLALDLPQALPGNPDAPPVCPLGGLATDVPEIREATRIVEASLLRGGNSPRRLRGRLSGNTLLAALFGCVLAMSLGSGADGAALQLPALELALAAVMSGAVAAAQLWAGATRALSTPWALATHGMLGVGAAAALAIWWHLRSPDSDWAGVAVLWGLAFVLGLAASADGVGGWVRATSSPFNASELRSRLRWLKAIQQRWAALPSSCTAPTDA
ncbi:hypothetical protein FNF29_02768 [Cafeteria roenbergensis]|uniref:Endonuclease/exonuclease/phosphatase domain-containing protein n=1 Tax=Cafeteria roenbergensis TaxID=33653 RepID=A0A5A8CN36_CAFRO|nr:hypothetical protein FNF29_02768 [Cafeteria roenbergensis]|eukprot:KAA0154148.1 hypothetical protein FNF29_02768 [Cafeteria roenbergensis]